MIKGSVSSSPLISIITVTYNAASHLQKCIDSVKDQSYQNIEHIIIDGGSIDGTIDLIKANAQHIASWISEPDTGIFNAMNKGLQHARGEWIYFLGADDTLYPEFSKLATLLSEPDKIYYGQCTWGDMILGGKFTPYRLTKECICHHSILYPKRVFEKYRYSEKYPTGGDHLLNIQCWNDKEFKKEYHPILIANFAQGGVSQITPDPLFEEDFRRIVRKYCGLPLYLRYWWKQHKKKNRS